MGFNVELEEGEELLYGEIFAPSDKMDPFAVGVSDRYVYFAKKKMVALKDPWTLRRFPHASVLSAELVKLKPYGWWVLSGILILAGLATSIWMLPGLGDPEATRSGYPFGVLAVGLVIPFVVRNRTVLKLNTVDGTFEWKSAITVDSGPRKLALEIQHAFIEACAEVGILTRVPGA